MSSLFKRLKQMKKAYIAILTFLVVVGGSEAIAQTKDPTRCIDQVPVWVTDHTDTFFAPFIVDQLKAKLADIESMDELELSLEQRERKSQYTSPRRDDDVEFIGEAKEVRKIRIRTSWKGGLKDLIFIQATPNATVGDADLSLEFDISDTRRPSLQVKGATCDFDSRRDTTIVSSYPEKIDGRNQNYKNLATFLAYQLIKLSEVEGCNLGSETRSVIVSLSKSQNAVAIPMGVEILSLEASAREEYRYEQIVKPDQNPNRAAQGQAETVFFNRPTDLVYRTSHPFKDLEWIEVQKWQVSDDDICDVFDKNATQNAPRSFEFVVPDLALHDAKLRLRMDPGAKLFQDNPDMMLGAKWFSDQAMTRLVAESPLVAAAGMNGEGIFEIDGGVANLLPGQYMVQLLWKLNPEAPVSESASFHWNSTDEYNVSDSRGVLGPQLTGLRRSKVQSAYRIMDNYFFQQAITKQFIRWESWPDSDPQRFAEAILWHFEETGQLPYLSQWEGEDGIASELVRALSVISKSGDALTEPDAQHALAFLGRFERAPESFNKRYMRRAMCSLSGALQERGEPIPALWMRCDG